MDIFFLQDTAPDVPHAPEGRYLLVESHGCTLFGRLMLPAFYDEDSCCPVVMMLHGHPGGDKNLDIAKVLQNNGFAVAVFSYRGVWGSHGDYSMSHNIEDTIVVAAYLRENAAKYRIDPERLYLFGHSMGGFSAMNAMASGLKASGAVLLAPYDAGYQYLYNHTNFESVMSCKREGYFRLASENALEEDGAAHAEAWYFSNLLPKLDKNIPYCFISGDRDTTSQRTEPFVAQMEEAGFKVSHVMLDDGHMFPRHRASLAKITLDFFSKAEQERT